MSLTRLSLLGRKGTKIQKRRYAASPASQAAMMRPATASLTNLGSHPKYSAIPPHTPAIARSWLER